MFSVYAALKARRRKKHEKRVYFGSTGILLTTADQKISEDLMVLKCSHLFVPP